MFDNFFFRKFVRDLSPTILSTRIYIHMYLYVCMYLDDRINRRHKKNHPLKMKGQPDRDKRGSVSGVDKAQLNTSRAYHGPSPFDATTVPVITPSFHREKGKTSFSHRKTQIGLRDAPQALATFHIPSRRNGRSCRTLLCLNTRTNPSNNPPNSTCPFSSPLSSLFHLLPCE